MCLDTPTRAVPTAHTPRSFASQTALATTLYSTALRSSSFLSRPLFKNHFATSPHVSGTTPHNTNFSFHRCHKCRQRSPHTSSVPASAPPCLEKTSSVRSTCTPWELQRVLLPPLQRSSAQFRRPSPSYSIRCSTLRKPDRP